MNVHAPKGEKRFTQPSELEMQAEIQVSQMKAKFDDLMSGEVERGLIADTSEDMKALVQETVSLKQAEVLKEASARLEGEEEKDADQVLAEVLREKIELAQDMVLHGMVQGRWDTVLDAAISADTLSGYSKEQIQTMTNKENLSDAHAKSLDFFLARAVIEVKEGSGDMEERIQASTKKQVGRFLQTIIGDASHSL
jgi:hypothetical protein